MERITGSFALDWMIIAVSLFNTILLLWLGLTVLLNANRRNWGVWLMGLGHLTGAAFFISHTAILGQEITFNSDGLNFWWQLGWIPITIAPFAWYVVILWYAGFWTHPRPWLYHRHRFWLILLAGSAMALIALIFAANPAYDQVVALDLSAVPTIGGIPAMLALFPVFMILCITLSIDVLFHPAPPKRSINALARQRSRPWLLAASGVLLLVSVIVTAFIVLLVIDLSQTTLERFSVQIVAGFDIVLSVLIGVAVLLVGQAIVSYEVFTGKVLPRRGFSRHWRNIILIGGGYAVVIGWSLAAQIRPVYSLLLTTLLMVTFYALYSWRSFVEREEFMAKLRPFVSSQNLTSHIMGAEEDTRSRANEMFQTICREVLGTDQAQLIPMGILGPLAGSGLHYPSDAKSQPENPPVTLQTDVAELHPVESNGYQWAIPLWAERGLIGTLLVGHKQDGGLYSQEEIEIAQASGERIIDMLAGEQVARRLMKMERNRLTENRVMDLHTRRVLHDEILPLLHTVVLQLSPLAAQQQTVKEAIAALTDIHRQTANLIHIPRSFSNHSDSTCDLQETLKSLVDTEFINEFESVVWNINSPPVVQMLVCDVLVGAVREILRNAALHARGQQPDRSLTLTVTVDAKSITIADDGVGVGQDKTMNGGHGLALHSTLLAVVGASMSVETRVEGGTQVTITLPLEVGSLFS